MRINPIYNGRVASLNDLPFEDVIGSVRYVESESNDFICVGRNLDVHWQWREYSNGQIVLPSTFTTLDAPTGLEISLNETLLSAVWTNPEGATGSERRIMPGGTWVNNGTDESFSDLPVTTPGTYTLQIRGYAANGSRGQIAYSTPFIIVSDVPENALLNTDGTPILNTDGSYILIT